MAIINVNLTRNYLGCRNPSSVVGLKSVPTLCHPKKTASNAPATATPIAGRSSFEITFNRDVSK